MNDPFGSAMFSMASLTGAITRIPDLWNQIARLGIFREEGVTSRTIMVESQDGILHMLPQRPVGGPSTLNVMGRRKLQALLIPHFPHDDALLPESVQGIRAFGTETQLETVAGVVARKLTNMRQKHSLTHEWMRLGALKGEVRDGENGLVYNYYTQFGITQKVIDTNMTVSTDPTTWMSELKTYIEGNLKGESMTQVMVLAGSTFMATLVGNTNVKEAYKYFQTTQPLSGDYRNGFRHYGIEFVEYPYVFTDTDGNALNGIPADTAYAFPMGTQNTFVTYFAPADFNETVNTIGVPIYAKSERRKFDRGVDIHTQSNPLPICLRPELLVKLTL